MSDIVGLVILFSSVGFWENDTILTPKAVTPDYFQANYITIMSFHLSEKLFIDDEKFTRCRLVITVSEGRHSAFLELLEYDLYEEVVVDFSKYYDTGEAFDENNEGIWSIRFISWGGNQLNLQVNDVRVMIEIIGNLSARVIFKS